MDIIIGNGQLKSQIKEMKRIEALHAVSKRENSKAAHYRIKSLLDGTAHEYGKMPKREVLLIAKGFIESSEVSGLITLNESDAYSATLKKMLK